MDIGHGCDPRHNYSYRRRGQLNGNFTIVDSDNGAQIGLRASDRTDGLLPPATGKNKGTYLASTGFNGATNNRAEWNYDCGWATGLCGRSTRSKVQMRATCQPSRHETMWIDFQ
jgi:hypothetical protein